MEAKKGRRERRTAKVKSFLVWDNGSRGAETRPRGKHEPEASLLWLQMALKDWRGRDNGRQVVLMAGRWCYWLWSGEVVAVVVVVQMVVKVKVAVMMMMTLVKVVMVVKVVLVVVAAAKVLVVIVMNVVVKVVVGEMEMVLG